MPVIAEYVPGYEVVSTQALFVPAKTPREIVGKISADINTVLGEAAIRAKLAEMGYAAAPSSPEELGKLLRSEIARWSAVIKSVGITLGLVIGAQMPMFLLRRVRTRLAQSDVSLRRIDISGFGEKRK